MERIFPRRTSTEPAAGGGSRAQATELAQRLHASARQVAQRAAVVQWFGQAVARAPGSLPSQVVQRQQRYMRAVVADDRVAGEINSLRRVFEGETNRQHQVNTWVDGFAGMPTTRYVAGKAHYYSPVGYQLEATQDAEVLANFSGDGNTNDIPTTHQKWLLAANALVARLHAIADWDAWYAGQQALPAPIAWDWDAPERATFVNRYVKSYVDTNRAGKAAVLDAVKTTGLEQLSAHYGRAGQARFLGTGLDPQGLAAAEQNPDVRYTESILHAKFSQVKNAWYNQSLGAYAEAQGQATWRDADGDWLAARRTSAEQIRDAFNNAVPNAGVGLLTIGPAPVAPVAPVVDDAPVVPAQPAPVVPEPGPD